MMDENEILWTGAFVNLTGDFGRAKTDQERLGALVALLRTNRPIPQEAREALADMIDPDRGGLWSHKLILKSVEKKVKATVNGKERYVHDTIREILSKYEYDNELKKGIDAQEAARVTAEKFDISDRTVFRDISALKEKIKWMKG